MLLDLDRILFEIRIMTIKFPQFLFYWGGYDNCAYFQGLYPSLTMNMQCELKLILSPYYPHVPPRLYVISPLFLWRNYVETR